jgi:hypothetical protein
MSNGVAATWQLISGYLEPNWAATTNVAPSLFWRKGKGAVLGFIRDGELFDAKSVYVCDANKVTHFSEIVAPE